MSYYYGWHVHVYALDSGKHNIPMKMSGKNKLSNNQINLFYSNKNNNYNLKNVHNWESL